MTLQVQGKNSLLSGYETGIAAIQQDRPSFEQTIAQKTVGPDGPEHSDGEYFGPKRRAASWRNVA